MNRVFVLSKTGKALMPCHPARARKLLHNKKARVKRLYPFTIQLTQRSNGLHSLLNSSSIRVQNKQG